MCSNPAGLWSSVIFPLTVTQNWKYVWPLPEVKVDWQSLVASGEIEPGAGLFCWPWLNPGTARTRTARRRDSFMVFINYLLRDSALDQLARIRLPAIGCWREASSDSFTVGRFRTASTWDIENEEQKTTGKTRNS